MLNCCVDINQVKQTGITFSTFACLAKCQGLSTSPGKSALFCLMYSCVQYKVFEI